MRYYGDTYMIKKISKLFINIFFLLNYFVYAGCSEESTPADSNDATSLEGYSLIWADEFEGTSIDLTKWEHEVNANGGGNNELQYYTDRPENSFVKDGMLHIAAQKENFTGPDGSREYTSARMRTMNKGDWKYCRIEVRAKIPYGQGIWPAIWMLSTDWEYGGWPASGEIDIMEHVGSDPGKIYGTVHTEAYNHNKGTQRGGQILVSDANSNYHVYAIEWSENKIDFYVDDQKYFTFTNDKNGNHATWPFDKRFHLLLNVAVGGNWPGNPNLSTPFPAEMIVDYVRVYKKN